MSKTDKKLSAVSLILIAVLIFTAVFNIAYVGNVASAATQNVAPSAAQNRFEKIDMDLSSFKEQYLNHELVQKNTASYDGDRWVIVALEGATLYDAFKASTRYSDFAAYSASEEGQRVQKSLKIAQSEFLSKLDRHGINYEFKYSYTSINNAVAVKVNAEAYNAIRKMNGVDDVYYVEYYDVPKTYEVAENNANVYSTGIYNSDGLGYQGEGMVVAVLDTGLDRTHEAFQTPPTSPAWDKAYIESVVAGGQLKAEGTADDFYYSSKVPFAYDYADDDSNVFPSYSSHGTHVAGIVAGKSDYVVNKETGETFKGVAPEAQLVICKVFTDNFESEYLGGANTMSILAALNDCTKLGVDVINMSLGTSAGFADEKSEKYINDIYETIEAEGISLVVAASNDYSSGFGGGYGTNLASNPDSGTVGSPSTYHSALSVASINGKKSSYILGQKTGVTSLDDAAVAFITTSSNEYGQEFKFIDQLYEIAGKQKGEELRFKYVVVSGVGELGNYTRSTLNQLAQKSGYDGTIALVKRGTNTFAEKVQAAMTTEADAVVIYNNVAGTIRMSLGEIDDPIPACSISMDAGNAFVELAGRSRVGTIIVNSSYEAGPFMSDFSSWGPTPDLQLKPEITAHGGEITSAVAGGYDKYSGTSMAAPNMAGAVAILRQYLQETYDLSGKELNERVNQVLMSTATIANNDENNPYSPRKQGAGLASIANAIKTESYLTVLSDGRLASETKGDVRSKTKIELYDDKDRTGEYQLDFIINNITDKVLTYVPLTHVMTESMSSDNKTVSEKAYMLTDMCEITYKVGADANSLAPLSGDIVVQPNQTLSVSVTIKLGAQAKQYLNEKFVNGMYVEGFVSLQPKANDPNTTVTVGLPYLAFYGDWNDAPLFDYDQFTIGQYKKDHPELEESELLKSSAVATMPVGMYWEDQYTVPLGIYLYDQPDGDVEITPDKEKICLSMFDDSRGHTVYELYALYAGLLRGAAYMDLVITDEATGEVIFTDKLENVRKSYANGGSAIGAPIMIELNPGEWGMQNNARYNVSVKGQLDYEGGENPKENSFEFPLTIDYEDPEMLSYRIRYMSYGEKDIKYRIYMDIDVRDNQFVSNVMPVYMSTRPDGLGGEEPVFMSLTEYPIAVNGRRGETSTVSFEITDIYEEYVKTGQLIIQVEDYAFNSTVYNVLPGVLQGEDAMNDPEYVHFVEDENLTRGTMSTDELGTPYYNYTLKITPNTLYKFKTEGNLDNSVLKSLTWLNTDSKVQAQGGEVFSGLAGRKTITLSNTTVDEDNRKTYAVVNVIISGAVGADPVLTSLNIGSVLDGDGIAVSVNDGTPLELNPNQTLKINWTQVPWYCPVPNVTWSSTNDKVVEVDQEGNIKALTRGSATVVLTAETQPGNPAVSKRISIMVGRDYDVRNYTLYHYYGGEVVDGGREIVIPSNLNIMYLSEYCFKGNTDIKKVTLPSSLTEIPEYAFMGCTNLEEIVIPGQCIAIKKYAFAGCTNLKKITLGKFVDSNRDEITDKDGQRYDGTISIGAYAFSDCTSLTDIENADRLTTLFEGAFAGCTSLESIDISKLRVAYTGIFKGCTKLKNVITSKDTALSVSMFESCTSLQSFAFKGNTVRKDMFKGCTALTNVTFEDGLVAVEAGAFEKTGIKNITLPNGSIRLAADAFKSSKLTKLTLSEGTRLVFANGSPFGECGSFTAYDINGSNEAYSVVDGVLYNSDVTEVVAVPYAKITFTMPDTVTSVANGALAGVNVATIDLSAVQRVGAYAFAGNTTVTSVKLPSGLTSIPEGLFDGCTKLALVTADDDFASVRYIGKNAFRDCKKLETVSMPAVVEIVDSAFEGSALKELPSDIIEKIGDMAFYGSKLTNITLNSLTKIGEGAFANISSLTSAALGAIEQMGYGVFIGSTALATVSFAEGTVVLGEAAFASDSAVSTALTVTLPASMTTIGAFAFYNQRGLTTIDLTHVTHVDSMAFCGTGLNSVDLSNIEYVGIGAFAFTNITSANLAKAKIVETNAFYNAENLATVTFGALESIGESVFTGTIITEITLPATFTKRTYEYEWDLKDEKGNVEDHKSRNELNFTPGAFMGADKLVAIKVAGENPVFFAEDGVLYSRVKKGFVLEQYPVAKADESYELLAGTVAIQSNAFFGVENLKNVELPYTVKYIGSNAFYNSSVVNYTFNSVEAPTLFATSLSEADVEASPVLKQVFGRVGESYEEAMGMTNFYANFSSFAIFADLSLWSQETVDQYGKFGLTMTIPLNAKGYGKIWHLFFETINYTAEIMPEDVTYRAIEAINALPTVAAIGEMGLDEVKSDGTVGKLASQARVAYNSIETAEQRALIAEQFQTLVNVEKALRDRKEVITGTKVKIDELVISKAQNKYRYVEGENFDPTGMELTAIYEDGSEVLLTGGSFDYGPKVMEMGVTEVTITYHDGDMSVSATVRVQVSEKPSDPEPVDPNPQPQPKPSDEQGLSTGAKIGIGVGVGAGVLIIAAVVAVVLILKKKKAAVASDDEANEQSDVVCGDEMDKADVAEQANDEAADVETEASEQSVEEANAEQTADGTSGAEQQEAEAEDAQAFEPIDTEATAEVEAVNEDVQAEDNQLTNEESDLAAHTGDSDNE